eukprot:10235625-Ditylum_brightwellii.AAC.1
MTDIIEPTELTTEPTTPTAEPTMEPSDNPMYTPLIQLQKVCPEKQLKNRKVTMKKKMRKNIFKEDVDPESTEIQDENNNKNTDTIEQELIQKINNSLSPTTSPDVDPPSTPTGGVSWADIVHHDNEPNAMP